MNVNGIAGLIFVLLFVILMLVFMVMERRQAGAPLRVITAFERLRRAIGLAVEDGSRLHLSLGRGSLIGPESAPALVGLSLLERITRTASMGDKRPVVTSGDSTLATLSRDSLKQSFEAIDEQEHYDPVSGQLLGLTPFSYAAGAMMLIEEEKVSANLISGSFGSEVALLADAGERAGAITIAGTDTLTGQAVLYAAAQEPLIGEEVFAGGAYLLPEPIHVASLRVEDILRWGIVVLILLGALLTFSGLAPFFQSILVGAP